LSNSKAQTQTPAARAASTTALLTLATKSKSASRGLGRDYNITFGRFMKSGASRWRFLIFGITGI